MIPFSSALNLTSIKSDNDDTKIYYLSVFLFYSLIRSLPTNGETFFFGTAQNREMYKVTNLKAHDWRVGFSYKIEQNS